MQVEKIASLGAAICENIEKTLFGKQEEIRLVVAALFAGGHILLDDIPGTGKTTLARALARSVDAECRRIQFTPDLLPSDITGINYYNQKENEFVFHPGPVFTNILIADEINRTTPRTQSALLECMGELQTSVDGVTYSLEPPFFAIATQNPIESHGTFPLPEAQTDRFLMRLSLGYPDFQGEMTMLDRYIDDRPLATLSPVCSRADVCAAGAGVRAVTVSEPVRKYIVALAEKSRELDRVRLGVSPRGTLALMRAAQSFAAISGRAFVLPDDVKAVAIPVLSHRIITRSQNTVRIKDTGDNIVDYLINTVPAPIA